MTTSQSDERERVKAQRETGQEKKKQEKRGGREAGRASRSFSLSVRELTVLAFLGAVLYVSQTAMAFLPNIELVSTLVLVYTLVFGRKALLPVYVFVLMEGVWYGFGIWWVMYLYVWAILYAAARLLRRCDSPLIWACVTGAFGLAFGLLCSLPYTVAGGVGAGIAWWMSGIPFDIMHCAGNFVLTFILYRPLKKVLGRVRAAC